MNKDKTNFVMYRIDRELYKQLQEIKTKNDLATINAVIKRLLKESKESKK